MKNKKLTKKLNLNKENISLMNIVLDQNKVKGGNTRSLMDDWNYTYLCDAM